MTFSRRKQLVKSIYFWWKQTRLLRISHRHRHPYHDTLQHAQLINRPPLSPLCCFPPYSKLFPYAPTDFLIIPCSVFHFHPSPSKSAVETCRMTYRRDDLVSTSDTHVQKHSQPVRRQTCTESPRHQELKNNSRSQERSGRWLPNMDDSPRREKQLLT